MSVGLLIVTHGQLGRHLLETVKEMLGQLTLATEVLEAGPTLTSDALLDQGQRALERLHEGDGVLILTDAYGSTPSNLAAQLAEGADALLVAGVNLPMLVRIFNYPKLRLPELAQAAIEGGQRGVVICPSPTQPTVKARARRS